MDFKGAKVWDILMVQSTDTPLNVASGGSFEAKFCIVLSSTKTLYELVDSNSCTQVSNQLAQLQQCQNPPFHTIPQRHPHLSLSLAFRGLRHAHPSPEFPADPRCFVDHFGRSFLRQGATKHRSRGRAAWRGLRPWEVVGKPPDSEGFPISVMSLGNP